MSVKPSLKTVMKNTKGAIMRNLRFKSRVFVQANEKKEENEVVIYNPYSYAFTGSRLPEKM